MAEKTPYDAYVNPKDSERIQGIVRAVQWVNEKVAPYKLRDHHMRTDDRDCSQHSLIFRGESRFHEECGSTLYRSPEILRALTQGKYSLDDLNYASFERGNVLISVANMVNDPTQVQPGECPPQLAKYRHHGGISNCLDFSGNFVSALYFAATNDPGENGRIIVVDTEKLRRNMEMAKKTGGFIHKPKPGDTGSLLQDSVFVNHPNGKLNLGADYTQNVVTVPADLKPDLLWVLDHYLWINEMTVYRMSSHMASRSQSSEPIRRMEYVAATLRYRAMEACTERSVGMLSATPYAVAITQYAGFPVMTRLAYLREEFKNLPVLNVSEPVVPDDNVAQFFAISEDLVSWRWRRADLKEAAFSGRIHDMAYHVKTSTSLLRLGHDGRISFLNPIERGHPEWEDLNSIFAGSADLESHAPSCHPCGNLEPR